MKLLWGTFCLSAAAMTLTQGAALTGADVGILASPEAIFVEHLFITGIGAWGLIELIKQGKKFGELATAKSVADAIDGLRDEMTAVLSNYQDSNDKKVEHMTKRVDELWERRGRNR